MTSWHGLSADKVAQKLETDSEQGLSEDQAAQRLDEYGPNSLPQMHKHGPVMRFLRQFHNILIYVLIGAAVITFFLGHYIDTGVILAVVLLNAVIGFIQEGKAEQAIDAIRHMLAPHATVMRNGRRHEIEAENLVPGDIVHIESGDKVPADLRLIKTSGLHIQEAILTGESVPVEKTATANAEDTDIGDRSAMAHSGTMVASGRGAGIVVGTGSDTEIGKISAMLGEVERLTTPLVRKMDKFAKWLTVFILSMAALIFSYGYFVRGDNFAEIFMIVVGLSVAAIPEGLPTVLTITLAIGVRTMARSNAIVRRLPAIETLGAVSVICSDKTGTLTRNEMMVGTVATAQSLYTISGSGYDPEGAIKDDNGDVTTPQDEPLLTALSRAACLCNDSDLTEKDGHFHVRGDPMEGALITFVRKAEFDESAIHEKYPRLDSVPFESEHRYMATLHCVVNGDNDDDNGAVIYVKGAPETILEMCTGQYSGAGKTEKLDRQFWDEKAAEIADRGERVLALAMRAEKRGKDSLSRDDVETDLVLLGLTGLIDPPRAEAIEAVKTCQQAGIRVKMITGDHGRTAAAIARQIGLENPDEVLTGSDLDQMSDEEFAKAALTIDVFARTSPEHKLKLVKALQADDMVIAMTGDGVNDAPALKRADVGIAMGRKGSEAAREASEMVLADDNFASIAKAVRAGRTVYDNLKKVILFLLPVNGGESLSLIVAVMAGLTLPISPVQILWVNMVSSILLAMSLAFEPSEDGTMKRPPRRVDEPILSPFLIWRIAFVSVLFSIGIFGQFVLAQWQGASLETARTMTVNTLVVMEIFYLFSVRYLYGSSLTLKGMLGTKAVLLAVCGVTALQFLFTYAPFMGLLFDTEPLSLMQGLQVIGFGVVVLVCLELEKQVGKRFYKPKGRKA